MTYISPYSYCGLKPDEAAKLRKTYFYRKIKKAKQAYANSAGIKKPFYEYKLDKLMIAMEEFTGIKKEELIAYNTGMALSDVRSVVVAVAVRLHLGSLKDMATYFNRKDHSTIHSAANVGQIRIRQDSDFLDLYNKLIYAIT